MLCFTRDTEVLSVFNNSTNHPILTTLKDKLPKQAIYPPNGIIPFCGFTMYGTLHTHTPVGAPTRLALHTTCSRYRNFFLFGAQPLPYATCLTIPCPCTSRSGRSTNGTGSGCTKSVRTRKAYWRCASYSSDFCRGTR